MKKQMITLANGETVGAHMAGKLAVCDDICIGQFQIIHIKSGARIAVFSNQKDALSAARKANNLMDFDTYAQSIADKGYKQIIEPSYADRMAVLGMFKSYKSFMPEYMTGRNISRETLKAKLQS